MQPKETRPLLQHPDHDDGQRSYRSLDSSDNSLSDDHPQPLNDLSKSDVSWILCGLWSAVFLGALDGAFISLPFAGKRARAHTHTYSPTRRFRTGTIVATLLSTIGSYFNRSNQSSYIGTSYLLSVCCFTPLYGKYPALPSFPQPPS